MQTLAKKYGRTRNSMYRVVNEVRAEKVVKQPVDYIYHASFDDPASETEIVALTDLVLANPAFVALPDKTGEHARLAGAGTQLAGSHDMVGGQLYTTQGVIDAEQIIMGRVQAAASETDYAVVPKPILEMAIGVAEAQQGYQLSGEQRAAVEATTASGAGLGAIEGPAGTGKTTMMRAARIAYEAAGYTVGGAATAAVAAQGCRRNPGSGRGRWRSGSWRSRGPAALAGSMC